MRSMVSVAGGSSTSWARLLGVGVHGQLVSFSPEQRVEDIQRKVVLPNTKGFYALVALPPRVAYYRSMKYNGRHSCTVQANDDKEEVEVRQAALRSCSVCESLQKKARVALACAVCLYGLCWFLLQASPQLNSTCTGTHLGEGRDRAVARPWTLACDFRKCGLSTSFIYYCTHVRYFT